MEVPALRKVMRRYLLALTVFVAAVILISQCRSRSLNESSDLDLPLTQTDPNLSLDFYVPPDPFPSVVPGTLIRAQELEPFALSSRAWRVLYVSQSINGDPIVVSGMVAAPIGPQPEAGYDVVSWAHGTKGISDACAPSRGYRSRYHDFFKIAPELVVAGYVATASDYEGLGTPGVHPYLVGVSEGRGTLDIIRAAAQIEGIGSLPRAVVWGRSQGGHAALFAGEIASTWTPEISLLGVISAAPASDLNTIASIGPLTGANGFIWQLSAGFEAAYDEVNLADIYSAEALGKIRELIDNDACNIGFKEAATEFKRGGIVNKIRKQPGWTAMLRDNSPGHIQIDTPVLMLQGTKDKVIPRFLTSRLYKRLCKTGTKVDYRVFKRYSHNDSTSKNMSVMLAWTADRFEGADPTPTCK